VNELERPWSPGNLRSRARGTDISVGAGGGRIIAAGTPEEVARNEQSATGRFLSDLCGRIATTAAKTAVV